MIKSFYLPKRQIEDEKFKKSSTFVSLQQPLMGDHIVLQLLELLRAATNVSNQSQNQLTCSDALYNLQHCSPSIHKWDGGKIQITTLSWYNQGAFPELHAGHIVLLNDFLHPNILYFALQCKFNKWTSEHNSGLSSSTLLFIVNVGIFWFRVKIIA